MARKKNFISLWSNKSDDEDKVRSKFRTLQFNPCNYSPKILQESSECLQKYDPHNFSINSKRIETEFLKRGKFK